VILRGFSTKVLDDGSARTFHRDFLSDRAALSARTQSRMIVAAVWSSKTAKRPSRTYGVVAPMRRTSPGAAP
jgi:hypothetical protein